jgi:hypothetical protein
MEKIIRFLLIINLLISCNNSLKSNGENPSDSERIITQSEIIKPEFEQTELITQKILDLPKLQWIYHPELKERLPVKILETELIKKNYNLNKFGQRVRILSESDLEKEEIQDYVIIDKILIRKDTFFFELHYKIEGASCSGKFLKENGVWQVLDYSVWEN